MLIIKMNMREIYEEDEEFVVVLFLLLCCVIVAVRVFLFLILK